MTTLVCRFNNSFNCLTCDLFRCLSSCIEQITALPQRYRNHLSDKTHHQIDHWDRCLSKGERRERGGFDLLCSMYIMVDIAWYYMTPSQNIFICVSYLFDPLRHILHSLDPVSVQLCWCHSSHSVISPCGCTQTWTSEKYTRHPCKLLL